MLIPVTTYLSQRDSPWADKTLGKPGQVGPKSTIGNYGCVITGLTMLRNTVQNRTDLTPIDTNARLVEVGGYTNNPPLLPDVNLLIWSKIPEAFPELRISGLFYPEKRPVNRAEFQSINYWLARQVPVIVCVDFSTAPGLQKHYVLLVGYTEGPKPNYLMADPWHSDGKAVPLCPRYGKSDAASIYRIALLAPVRGERQVNGGADQPLLLDVAGPTI